ncbi:MAG: YheT family hydrolase [Gemmataceae bacterium]
MSEVDRWGEFRPLPLLHNGHLQTVAGFLWKGRPFQHPTRRAILHFPDGDALVLHDSVPPQWKDGDPVALLVHGMGGDYRSGYVQRVGGLLYPRGVRVVRIDLRGTGAGFELAKQFYHGGRSEDVREALIELHRWAPASPLWLLGFSLGGNLALKLAGEAAADPVPNLARVATVAPPIDIVRCSELISQPRNRVYDRFFANQLVYLARVRQRYHPDPPLPAFPRRLTIRQFDELFTAPRCGFADALDYYRKASSFPLIGRIQVPTLIVTARDDPFVAVEPFEELRPPDQVRLEIHARGGHLGFLGRNGERWVERRLVDWLLPARK